MGWLPLQKVFSGGGKSSGCCPEQPVVAEGWCRAADSCSAHLWFLDNTASETILSCVSCVCACVCCVWVCLCAYHLIGTAKPPLPSSLKLRTPGKDTRAFGTCSRMNFSFTCLCQLSPLFLSLYLGLTRLLPLSLTSIVSCSVSNSTPGTCASGEGKHKSNPHATPTALMKHSLKRTV